MHPFVLTTIDGKNNSSSIQLFFTSRANSSSLLGFQLGSFWPVLVRQTQVVLMVTCTIDLINHANSYPCFIIQQLIIMTNHTRNPKAPSST